MRTHRLSMPFACASSPECETYPEVHFETTMSSHASTTEPEQNFSHARINVVGCLMLQIAPHTAPMDHDTTIQQYTGIHQRSYTGENRKKPSPVARKDNMADHTSTIESYNQQHNKSDSKVGAEKAAPTWDKIKPLTDKELRTCIRKIRNSK